MFFRDVSISSKLTILFALLAFQVRVYDIFSLIHAWIPLAIIPLIFKKTPFRLIIILMLFAALTVIQFYMFDDVIRSIEFLNWSRIFPPGFALLIIYIYFSWMALTIRDNQIASLLNYISVYIISITVIYAILFHAAIIDETFDLWQNNPNDTSLICVAAWLHILFHSNRSSKPLNSKPLVFIITFLTLLITVMASSRWLSIFIVMTFLWWLTSNRNDSVVSKSILNPKIFFFGTFAGIFLVAMWAAFAQFLEGSFLQLNFDPQANGIKTSLLWEGYQGYAPLRSSIGYRINGVFAAIGTVVQSWGLGIGVGRSVAVNGMISGYPGSLHVVIAEWILELGLIFPALVWFIMRNKLREIGFAFASAPVIVALFSMMAQTTGYITHYFTWFVFVSLVYNDLPAQKRLVSRAPMGNQRAVARQPILSPAA